MRSIFQLLHFLGGKRMVGNFHLFAKGFRNPCLVLRLANGLFAAFVNQNVHFTYSLPSLYCPIATYIYALRWSRNRTTIEEIDETQYAQI